jgi:hypothetical protein
VRSIQADTIDVLASKAYAILLLATRASDPTRHFHFLFIAPDFLYKWLVILVELSDRTADLFHAIQGKTNRIMDIGE